MSRLRRLWHRLMAAGRPAQLDRDFDAERRAHLDLAADEYERQGLSRDEARRRARLAFGGEAGAVELHRDVRALPSFEGLLRDLSYACRSLRRDAGLASAAVLILAIGIGANTAVFSLIHPILLKPLPFERAGQLVWVANVGTSGLSGATFQVGAYEGLQQQTRSFRDWTAYFAFSGFGNNTLVGRDTSRD